MANLKQLNGNYMGQLSEVRPAAKIFTATYWWDVPGKTALAAYQPKGAASQAAAKINLENPGTYDLSVLDTEPTWNATDGFIFTGIGGYNTGVSATLIKTMVATVTNMTRAGIHVILGVSDGSAPWNQCTIYIIDNTTRYDYGGSNNVTVADTSTSATYCIAMKNGYKNGIDVCDIPAGGIVTTNPLYVGRGSGTPYPYVGYIESIALYSDELSAAEIAALTTRMQAL